MRATGIVRRVDELGRVVIPREIRRSLKIHDGDPLEIFIDGTNLVLKKYNFDEVDEAIKTLQDWIEDYDSDAHKNMSRSDRDNFKRLLKEANAIREAEEDD